MVIVTELLPGMSLRKYLMSIRPQLLELQVAINFALDIARAMDWLHANGIIHRDLKPGTYMYIYNTLCVMAIIQCMPFYSYNEGIINLLL